MLLTFSFPYVTMYKVIYCLRKVFAPKIKEIKQ